MAFNKRALSLIGLLLIPWAAQAQSGPPAQKLPSALVVLPLIRACSPSISNPLPSGCTSGESRETRIDLLNLTSRTVDVQCFYVDSDSCNEVGFFVTMTPFQPVSWLASQGFSNRQTFSAAPPFVGEGELKCAVIPSRPEVEFHNAIQARAIIYGSDGQTVGYSATGFRRLSDGDYTGLIQLDGVTYEQCPDKLHFTVLGESPGTSESEMVLVPCTQDLLTQTPSQPNVSYTITNEFEQSFSAGIRFKCFDRRFLTDISSTLGLTALGSTTAHVVVRGVGFSLIGLAIDNFTFNGQELTAGNDPSFQGGRSATVTLP
jgi:hypothetical protein